MQENQQGTARERGYMGNVRRSSNGFDQGIEKERENADNGYAQTGQQIRHHLHQRSRYVYLGMLGCLGAAFILLKAALLRLARVGFR